MPKYDIEVTDLAGVELRGIRSYDQRRIVDEIRSQLSDEPTVPTRRRKRLDSVVPPFEHVQSVWQLRVGDYRVFYDVDDSEHTVYIRAVREKKTDQTTEDIIQ